MKHSGLIIFFLMNSLLLSAEDTAPIPQPTQQDKPMDMKISLWGEGKAEEKFSFKSQILFTALSDLLDLRASASVNSDKKYGADIANFKVDSTFMGSYFLLEEGSAALKFQRLSLTAGRMAAKDAVSSPYSLFINANSPAANSMVFKYEDSLFAYESRWIELNNRSYFGSNVNDTPEAWQKVWNGTIYTPGGTGFPDRGANLKTFTFKAGNMRFGLQDSAVYTQRNFDFEYFVSPIPEYFTQYVKTTDGRPWTTGGNENNIIGTFWTWKEQDFDLGVQLLLDDFSGHFVWPEGIPNNPWKVAWSLGGKVNTPWGRVGLFHAGATKYTFEPITTQQGQDRESAYGYSYYPDTVFMIDGSPRALTIQDYALGYTHGENNLALMATYENTFLEKLKVNTSLEFVLAGNNSPANPWQDATYHNEIGTQLLNDDVWEKRLFWKTNMSYQLGDWELYLNTTLGGLFNVMSLENPAGANSSWSALDRYVKIFKPSSDSRAVVSFSIGVKYTWDINKIITGQEAPKP